MTILLWVLRGIGILLLAALVLLAAALLLPAGIEVQWRQGRELEVWLTVGPFRRRFFPPRAERPETAGRPQALRGAADDRPSQPTAVRPERAGSDSAPPAGPGTSEKRAPDGVGAAPRPGAGAEKPASGGSGVQQPYDEVDAMYERLMGDPVRYAKMASRWAKGPGGILLRRLRVRHVRVVWTVTGPDAAATAVTYGALIAACNTAWAILQDLVDIRAEELRIEPDFTGERTAERCFACQITARMVIILVSVFLTVSANAKRRSGGKTPGRTGRTDSRTTA